MSSNTPDDPSTAYRALFEEVPGVRFDPFSGELSLVDRVYLINIALAMGISEEIANELFDSTRGMTAAWARAKAPEGERDKPHSRRSHGDAKHAAYRMVENVSCSWCGASFLASGNARYCSSACRRLSKRRHRLALSKSVT